MRTLPKIFLGAAIATVVVSCASVGPGPAQSQAPSAAENQGPAPAPISDHNARGTAEAGPGPVEDSLQNREAASDKEGQPADVPLGLPAAPRARSGPEVQSVESAGPSPSQSVPLSTPQPPTVSSSKRAASTVRPGGGRTTAGGTPKPQAAAIQSPASPATTAQGGAARSPQSEPAGNGAPAAPSQSRLSAAQSAASSASTVPYGRLREIYARPGDDVQISLDGEGFLFLGFPDISPDGMSFKGKETRDGKTLFGFKASKLGTYDLDFLRQDNGTGTSSKETVRVHVVSDADFSAQLAQGDDRPPESAEPGDLAFAEKLSSLGQYEAAIAELLKGYRDGNPDLNDRIAQLYLRTGAYDAAGKYFSKNLSQQGRLGESAVIGLARIAMAQKDQAALLSLLKRLLAVRGPGLEETLISAVRFEKDRQEIGLGINLATEYLARYPDGRWVDEADYLLAQLLEGDSRFRDIKRARTTYSEILTRFPESTFAGTARERIGYIDRHFFQVR